MVSLCDSTRCEVVSDRYSERVTPAALDFDPMGFVGAGLVAQDILTGPVTSRKPSATAEAGAWPPVTMILSPFDPIPPHRPIPSSIRFTQATTSRRWGGGVIFGG